MKRWTQQQIQYLKDNYGKITVTEIGKALDRTDYSVQWKASQLKLYRTRPWAKLEEDYVKEYYESSKTRDIAKQLDRSVLAVTCRANKLGIYKPEMTVNDEYFQTWTPQMAWMLGFFAADGCVHLYTETTATFTYAQKDKELIENIKQELSVDREIHFRKRKQCYCIVFTSRQMYGDICSIFGMDVQRKSKTLVFPTIPQEYLRYFYLGCFDGDGHIGISNRQLRLTYACGSKAFTEGFHKSVLDQTGIEGNIRTQNGAYTLNFPSIKGLCMCHYMYDNPIPFCLERKQKKARDGMRKTPRRVWRSSLTPKMEQVFSHILDGIPRMPKHVSNA